MKKALLLLVIFILLAVEVPGSDAAQIDDPEPVDSIVQLITYRTEAGSHLLLKESASSAYSHVNAYIYGSGDLAVIVDGDESHFIIDGFYLVPFVFNEGSSHSIIIHLDSHYYEYEFTVRKSIKFIEDEEEDIVTMTESQFNNEKIKVAAFSFIASVLGVYIAYRIARWKAQSEVRPL